MNCKQRSQRGGKPIIIVNEQKFIGKELCPSLFTVPPNIEATWILIRAKNKESRSEEINYIAVCSYYISKLVTKSVNDFYDHFTEAYNLIVSKYGLNVKIICCGDSNRMDLSPILQLSTDFTQEVKVPTRLNPDVILDTIITTLGKYYSTPVTKTPIENDNYSGRPSDHLVVLWRPLIQHIPYSPRKYKTVEFRPLPESGISLFGRWLSEQRWNEVLRESTIDRKAEVFQQMIYSKYCQYFPLKTLKVSDSDQPWYMEKFKELDRRKKREYDKHQKSMK